MTGFRLFCALLIGISTLIVSVCIIHLVARRASEAQKYVTNIMSLVILFLMGYFFAFTAQSQELLLIGTKLQLIATLTTYMSVFMIFQQVYNIRIPVPYMSVISLWFGFLLTMIVLASPNGTSEVSTWFYKEMLLHTNQHEILYFTLKKNWGFILYIITHALFFIAISGIFLQAQIGAKKRGFGVNTPLYFFVMIPLGLMTISSILPQKNTVPLLAPIILFFTVYVALMILKEHFSNLFDLSYLEIMNSLQSPLFILDSRLFVRHVNTAAKVLFPEYVSLAKSSNRRIKAVRELQDIIMPPQDVSKDLFSDQKQTLHIANKVFDPELRRVTNGRILYGYVILLHNVTEQQNREEMLADLNKKLSGTLRQHVNKIHSLQDKFVSGAIQFMADKDIELSLHVQRVSLYAYIIARQMRSMGIYTDVLTDNYLENLSKVAPLHDVGKIMLPADLLKKQNPSAEEIALLKTHTTNGARFIDRMIVNNPDSMFYTLSHQVALSHHEHWDGSGGPEGLKEYEIPIAALIVSVANRFDKLSSLPAKTDEAFENAFSAIQEDSGTRFAPSVIAAFVSAKEKIKEAYKR